MLAALFARDEAKAQPQVDDLFGAGDQREVEGLPPVRCGLPPEPETERDSRDPFDHS
jgi:hypothetical protein